MRLPMLFAALSVAASASANPFFLGLPSTGLESETTEAVTLVEEDLQIDLDRISIDYLFRNTTDAAVTGKVVFPLPPIQMFEFLMSPRFAQGMPEPGQLVDFSVRVNGEEIAATVDLIAVIEPDRAHEDPLARLYDVPGRDVTADLLRLGLPVSIDPDGINPAILALSADAADEAVRLGMIDPRRADDAQAYQRHLWSLAIRHHWTQTFPAGQDVRISISYRNLTDGIFFDGQSLPVTLNPNDAARYCVDDVAFARVATAVMANPGDVWSVSFSKFILRTAHSWAGPIGRFRLTIDTKETDALAFTCIDGMVQTGLTTTLWEETDFIPSRDLEIAFVRREMRQ